MSRKRKHEDAEEDVFVYYEHTKLSSIPSGITSLRIDSSVKKIPPHAFEYQRNLVRVEYEEGLEVIGEKAFANCSGLREQQFPSTLVEIETQAFSCCHSLESVGHLPRNLRIIRENAFFYCDKLKSIEIYNNAIHLEPWAFYSCQSLTHCRLPRGIVTIPECLFAYCQSLADVNVPSTVTEIGGNAFQRCTMLSMIELPTELKKIAEYAFEGAGLENFCCPPRVESIGHYAFQNCQSLESVILPPKLEVIKCSTFENCQKLRYIDIPQYVSEIEQTAFRDCSALKEINLPRTGLTRIQTRTFEGCTSLTHLWVPPTVEYVENRAFASCIKLLSVEVPETLERLVFAGRDNWGNVIGCKSLVNIYIPPSYKLDDVQDEDFMEEMRLGEAEGSYPELVDKLKRRFDSLPLHRACYFQSYHSVDANLRTIRKILRSDGSSSCEQVDFLGMNPFHILALAHRPSLNLFQKLLPLSSVDILKSCDVFGSTPIDYLCQNHSSVTVTKAVLLTIIERRISWLGLESWRAQVMTHMEEVQMADAASLLASKVTSVCNTLFRLERMEAYSLLEMSIWRMKAQKEKATESEARESCRINCGSSIVLEHVVSFLGLQVLLP